MAVYFISDLHLQPGKPELAEALFTFVEQQAEDAEELYILGDFFDAWIGDDEDDPFYLNIELRLKRWVDNGLAVYFQHGNRDFLVGERFAEITGLSLLPEVARIQLPDREALVMHGDSLCIDDSEYQQFRAQVRTEAWQQQILAMPLDQRRQIARQLKDQSQSMNAMKAEDIMDVNAGEVVSVMSAHNVQTLIHGHTHRPAVHDLTVNDRSSHRYVLGDWGNLGWFIRADKTGLQLKSFSI